MRRLTILDKANIKMGSGRIYYKLLRLKLAKDQFYLIFISYDGANRLCTLDCTEKGIAFDIFASIIKTKTTPLSLDDAIYDLQK